MITLYIFPYLSFYTCTTIFFISIPCSLCNLFRATFIIPTQAVLQIPITRNK